MAAKYVFVYEKDRSREYALARNAVRVGASKVRKQADWMNYHVGLKGEGIGMPRTFDEAKARARALLKNKPVGVEVRIEARKPNGDFVDRVRFRKLEAAPKVIDTPAVEGVDRFMTMVRDKFPKARFAGACVCKNTASGSHSDHADCAAVDYFDTMENMVQMKNEALRRADYYHTKYVILGQLIYFPGLRPKAYSGQYHAHIHLSVNGGVHNKACR